MTDNNNTNELSEARSPAGAEAILAVLNGASVGEAYQRQGFDLPPVGSQVPNLSRSRSCAPVMSVREPMTS